MEFEEFTVGENDANRRLDRVIRKMFPRVPLSRLYALIRTGKIRVNGKKTHQSAILVQGDVVQAYTLIHQSAAPLPSSPRKPVSPQLAVLYRDADFLVLNKPRHVLVHGKQSLDSAVKAEYTAALAQSGKKPSLSFTPGPLHRLDGGTSGILVFSQSLRGAQTFSAALRNGKILRFYTALVVGRFSGQCEFQSPVDGKPAHTVMRRLRYFAAENVTLVEIQIFTGRKHQIRIHCAANGFPLFGDAGEAEKNRNGKKLGGYFLHFSKMQCLEKVLNLPEILFAPLPAYFPHGNGD